MRSSSTSGMGITEYLSVLQAGGEGAGLVTAGQFLQYTTLLGDVANGDQLQAVEVIEEGINEFLDQWDFSVGDALDAYGVTQLSASG